MVMHVAIVVASATCACVSLWLWAQQQQRANARIRLLEAQLSQKDAARATERQGRVAAEKELRRVMQEKLDTSRGYFVQSIATVSSCFKHCLGTPRQGYFAPDTRGRIELHRNISPEALDGLEDFSHVWIIFVFHMNTNGSNVRAHSGLLSDSHRHTFRAKVAPPMLKKRVGIFCTRTPHRPNPIDITLAKVASIDKKQRAIFITGLDLVDGTPVLDIKPYVPQYDAITDARIASWLTPDGPALCGQVTWKDDADRAVLEQLAHRSTHYRGAAAAFVRAVEQVLLVDVRSNDQTARLTTAHDTTLVLDNARITYGVDTATGIVTVLHIAEAQTAVQPPSANGVAQASMSKADKDKREKTSDGNPSCVGLYVDALDSKNLWAEGKIISCSTKKQLVKVHFPGWHKRHDVWNDVGSIAAHGAFARM
ncbi:TPA: hypothetical protein N0F65_005907 [Lagenidium giganteum]|uniref:TsaA-like domain-containing protein n=1 Tax=Lagenidium giganteum TaxID=4803 RepID=A0AAV2ZAD2_9STRA|nr:TPA: hypothetical protein N0F65_005907 [Lagenidium giganteum]